MAPSTASESRPFLKAGGGHAEPPCRICPRGAARRADLLLAKRGPGTQYFCRREFRRRAGARRWSRSSRLPASASREGPAASRLPQSCGGKGGWGKRSSCTSWTRGSLPERVRLLCRGDRGGRGRQRGRDRDPPRDGGGRLRHGRQSRQRRGADPGRPHLRAHGRLLQRDHNRQKVGDWTEDALAHYLATGHAERRGTAAGPMGEAVDLSSCI